MTPIDHRVRLWAWLVQRQGSIGTKSEAEVVAMQARHTPGNAVINRILGTVVPGTEVRSAGVPVRFTEYVGMPHGYLNFPGVCRGAHQAMAELCTEQAAALAPAAAGVPGAGGQ